MSTHWSVPGKPNHPRETIHCLYISVGFLKIQTFWTWPVHAKWLNKYWLVHSLVPSVWSWSHLRTQEKKKENEAICCVVRHWMKFGWSDHNTSRLYSHLYLALNKNLMPGTGTFSKCVSSWYTILLLYFIHFGIFKYVVMYCFAAQHMFVMLDPLVNL